MRVAIGSSRMAVSVITAPSCVLVVSTCAAFASTVTVSADPPTTRFTVTRLTWPMVTTISFSTYFLKPLASALSS